MEKTSSKDRRQATGFQRPGMGLAGGVHDWLQRVMREVLGVMKIF